MVGANVFVVRGHRYHAKGVKTMKKTVVLLLVSVVLLVGVIGTVSAGDNTYKEKKEYFHLEFPDEHCSNVPVLVVVDGIFNFHSTVNDNSIHMNFKLDAEAKVLDAENFTLLDTDQVKSLLNENYNKENMTIHQNHIFKGQFVDGTEWHGVLVEQLTLNANGDVVVDFERENFINCP
jgi:hypothetical protein